jgi:hypothetical protein
LFLTQQTFVGGFIMTRKDYVAIAEILANYHREGMVHQADLIDAIAADFARLLANDNPRFDRERFLAASGVQS